jgi:hypothetical protein
MARSSLIDIDVQIMDEREKAIAVADGSIEATERGERIKWFWLPRSQIEIISRDENDATITLPRWLAEEKGLV